MYLSIRSTGYWGVWSIGGTSPGEWISKKRELNRGLKMYAEMALRPGAAEGGSPWISIFKIQSRSKHSGIFWNCFSQLYCTRWSSRHLARVSPYRKLAEVSSIPGRTCPPNNPIVSQSQTLGAKEYVPGVWIWQLIVYICSQLCIQRCCVGSLTLVTEISNYDISRFSFPRLVVKTFISIPLCVAPFGSFLCCR